ncbi:HD-GYP domain-containing protein [Anaerostipes sp. MSJ-23]|uniref:HD-GYP domain-containing protein n=1 Tax=unclassified Anaerostipes TaxID=2635253 RepID=UPI001C115795|nr:HD domain-containing phosphohydrolase [Anaerostipes sp. MSJ-23]MBU5460243.1 HD domain-containing protein [Anaerostipes sp. MSJ-23]
MAVSYGRADIETPIQAGIIDTLSHGIVVSNLAYLVGRELQLDDDICHDLAVAGLLHDLGKVRLNFYMNEKEEEILAVDETRYMRMHPSIGYAILVEYGYNQTVLDAVLYHHENYDGTGYPHNLKGKNIPLAARIMHVCDVFGALISNRDYREAFDVETALDIIIDDVKNFDMKVFLAFQRVAFSDSMKEVIEKANLDEIEEEET